MTRPGRLVLAALAALVSATACGHGTPRHVASSASPASSSPSSAPGTHPSGAAPSGSQATGSNGGSVAVGTKGSAAPSGTSAPGATSSPGASGSSGPVDVTLDVKEACVSPGGVQKLEIHTSPDATIVIDTMYTDGKDGRTHGGAKKNGRSDGTGLFIYSFIVLKGTPPGPATIYVFAQKDDKVGQKQGAFQVGVAC